MVVSKCYKPTNIYAFKYRPSDSLIVDKKMKVYAVLSRYIGEHFAGRRQT